VPHHGPILPRIVNHALDPLGSTELSIRYTGYEPTQFVRIALGFMRARSTQDFFGALDKYNREAAFNCVAGDDQGQIGWSQILRMPRRAAGHAPWKVLPGDGSAEWGGDLDPKYIPHAYDPDQGFIATANNDPIGVTDDND